jgi:hypothetical protein
VSDSPPERPAAPGPPPLPPVEEGSAGGGPSAPGAGASYARDERSGRTFPCERCGADLVFHAGAQRLRCRACGSEQDLTTQPGPATEIAERDLEARLEELARERTRRAPQAAAREVRCRGCGATVTFQGTLTAGFCAYCGVPLQREGVHEAAPDRLPVDALLTFRVEAPAARAALAQWARSRWFAPSEFNRRRLEGRLEATYLPFFSFDATTGTWYRGQRGDHYWVTTGHGKSQRRELRTRWSPASGSFERFFDDVFVPAFGSLPEPLLRQLEPWPVAEVRPFTPEALAGALAHTYDVELPAAFGIARARIAAAIEAEARARIGGDVQRVDELRTRWAGLTYKHLLFPVWLLAYRYGDRSYRVAVNACTGEVNGERPYSVIKIALAVIVALAVAVVFAWLQGT